MMANDMILQALLGNMPKSPLGAFGKLGGRPKGGGGQGGLNTPNAQWANAYGASGNQFAQILNPKFLNNLKLGSYGN
jgi:hypothetical protein